METILIFTPCLHLSLCIFYRADPVGSCRLLELAQYRKIDILFSPNTFSFEYNFPFPSYFFIWGTSSHPKVRIWRVWGNMFEHCNCYCNRIRFLCVFCERFSDSQDNNSARTNDNLTIFHMVDEDFFSIIPKTNRYIFPNWGKGLRILWFQTWRFDPRFVKVYPYFNHNNEAMTKSLWNPLKNLQTVLETRQSLGLAKFEQSGHSFFVKHCPVEIWLQFMFIASAGSTRILGYLKSLMTHHQIMKFDIWRNSLAGHPWLAARAHKVNPETNKKHQWVRFKIVLRIFVNYWFIYNNYLNNGRKLAYISLL